MGMNVFDRNAGFAAGQAQILGFDKDTGIDSKSYGAPGAKIFYVDPNNAQCTDLGNLGEDPTVPLATVAAAIVLARPYMGDTIVVGANEAWRYATHTYRPLPIRENVVIPPTKGGIRIVGAATNPLAVTWTPTDDNEVAITVNACDVLIEGFCFYPISCANTTAISAVWNSTTGWGENLTVRNCYFDYNLDYGISLTFAWNCQIYDNHFESTAVAAIFSTGVGGDADYNTIRNNKFSSCSAALSMASCDHCFIHGNLVYGNGTGTNNFINLTGGANNLVSDNFLACTIAQYNVTCSDATSGAWINNHCTNGDTTAPPI